MSTIVRSPSVCPLAVIADIDRTDKIGHYADHKARDSGYPFLSNWDFIPKGACRGRTLQGAIPPCN